MFYYVYLQPETFDEALLDGDDAVGSLLSILRRFSQNCFLSVFEDDRWDVTVKEKLQQWPENQLRSNIAKYLVHLKKQKRFLYNIAPDYSDVRSDLDCVFDQAESIQLDLIVIIELEQDRIAPNRVELSTRRQYELTNFEPIRSEIAVYGKTCNIGDMEEIEFMEFHFAKAVKYASEINICDRVCGNYNFTGNFRYTTKRLLIWLSNLLQDPSNCKIVFHMGNPSGQGSQYILEKISDYKQNSQSGFSIEVNFYDESLPDPGLPHQRFILTDQIALDVDRGLDFLDRNTGLCRDTYINYQNKKEAQRLLKSYESGCVSKHAL